MSCAFRAASLRHARGIVSSYHIAGVRIISRAYQKTNIERAHRLTLNAAHQAASRCSDLSINMPRTGAHRSRAGRLRRASVGVAASYLADQ